MKRTRSSDALGKGHDAEPPTKTRKIATDDDKTPESYNKGFGTRAIHAGQPPEPTSGAVVVPISMSATFQQKSPGVHQGYEYSRSGNPTRNPFEQLVASLENAKHGLAYASGLAATANVAHLLQAGDHVLAMDDCYGGTYRYFVRVASNLGLKSSFVDFAKPGALEAAFTPQTKLVWFETPTNPLLKIVDIEFVARVAHAHNALVVVDNTFMSPYFQKPLTLGADIVVHSVTKYLNGHSDLVMGAIATNSDDLEKRLRFLQNAIGAIPSPFDCFLAMRGIKTLHLRMREHEKHATEIAHFLEKHPKVERVLYPGLKSHPQYELGRRQMAGAGGMITFFLRGGLDESRMFLEALKVFAVAESLGGVESLVDHPAIMTHASVPPAERAKLGISDNLVRLSVGVEDANDLLEDIKQALDAVKA